MHLYFHQLQINLLQLLLKNKTKNRFEAGQPMGVFPVLLDALPILTRRLSPLCLHFVLFLKSKKQQPASFTSLCPCGKKPVWFMENGA